MIGFLGIDHPLVAVHDLERTSEQYQKIGFIFKPQGLHPWGTAMRVAQMQRSAIELMSVQDPTRLDDYGPEGFVFGRHVSDRLAEREGIAMTALYSEDAVADVAQVTSRGILCQGAIEFGRDVINAAGKPDRTRTTLMMLGDRKMPRLANFICHQHRPDLIHRPEFQVHPNGAKRITQITILAERGNWDAVRGRLAGLYGDDAIAASQDGFWARTGGGVYAVMDRSVALHTYGELPRVQQDDLRPSCIAIHVEVPDLTAVARHTDRSGFSTMRDGPHIHVQAAEALGGVFISFDGPGAQRS